MDKALLDRLHFHAVLAKLAYWNREGGKESVAGKIKSMGFVAVNFIEHKETDTECIVAKKADGSSTVIFRGTTNVRDWKTNLKFSQDNGVHRGFKKAYEIVGHEIYVSVDRSKPVTVCGHSLGGALTTLCAYDLKVAGYDVQAVYTYGSPRVGNKSFAKKYNRLLKKITHRVVNNNDIVPRIPPPVVLIPPANYCHVDNDFYIESDGDLTREAGYWHNFGDHVKGHFAPQKGEEWIGDHDIDNYIAHLSV